MEDRILTEENVREVLELEVIQRIANPILERLYEIEEQIGKPLIAQNIRIEVLNSPQRDLDLIPKLAPQADYSQEELQTIESILQDDGFLQKLEDYIKDQIYEAQSPIILH